jgi:hypothetical protein
MAAVCRPADDGGRAMRFDRAVRQRGMAAAAGTRRHGGDRGQRPGRRCPCRGMRRCRMAPLWYQNRLAGPGLLGSHRALPGGRRRHPRLPRSRDKEIQPETERHHQRQRERQGPARLAPSRSLGRRGQQLLQAYCRQHLRRPADRVVLLDQRPGVGPDGLGDATNVPPRVEIAAAPGVVVALDPPDDRFPYPGPLTDLGNGDTGSLARFRQGCTDRHTAPPQLCRPAYRPRGQEARRSRPIISRHPHGRSPASFCSRRAAQSAGHRTPTAQGAGGAPPSSDPRWRGSGMTPSEPGGDPAVGARPRPLRRVAPGSSPGAPTRRQARWTAPRRNPAPQRRSTPARRRTTPSARRAEPAASEHTAAAPGVDHHQDGQRHWTTCKCGNSHAPKWPSRTAGW